MLIQFLELAHMTCKMKDLLHSRAVQSQAPAIHIHAHEVNEG